jgi:nicotinate-nucleotide adenylyltransferase
MKKFAILGGTFNPIHQGHLLIAEMALHQHHLNRIIWVPTYHPLHKATAGLAEFPHRLEMVKQAIAPYAAYSLSDVEQNIEQKSGSAFAIDTLSALQAIYPNCQWYWILGLDAFQTLPHWYGRRDLADRCQWIVAPRLVSDLDINQLDLLTLCQKVTQQMQTEEISLCWHLLRMQSVSISSSLVRQSCREHRSLEGLVPPVVKTYILTHQLYQKAGETN